MTMPAVDDTPDVSINSSASSKSWSRPLSGVRYRRSLINDRIREAGFAIEQVVEGFETNIKSDYDPRRTRA